MDTSRVLCKIGAHRWDFALEGPAWGRECGRCGYQKVWYFAFRDYSDDSEQVRVRS